MTKSSYVESVLKAIEDATSSSSNSSCDISVKLLLSIDRSRIEDAEETLKLVEAFSTQSDAVVVGLDLSGHPNVSLANLYIIKFINGKHLTQIE